MDVAAERTTAIFAPIGGTVTKSVESGMYGNHVLIYHPCPPETEQFGATPVLTLYAHMERRDVDVGEIAAGTQIGQVGDTGVPGRVHLHFSVRHVDRRHGRNEASSAAEEDPALRINPADWLAAIGVPVGPAELTTGAGPGPNPAGGTAPAEPVQRQVAIVVQRQEAPQTDQQRYSATLHSAGTTVAAWDAGYGPASFLGVTIRNGAHQELRDRLALAEASLQAQLPGTSLAAIASQVGLSTISGKRKVKNAVGGSRLSMHSYGLAIDVNYSGNPFLGRSAGSAAVINRIVRLMTGNEFRIREQQAGSIEAIRQRYADASDAFARYFAMRGHEDAIRTFLTTRGEDASDERVQAIAQQIEADAQDEDLLADMAMSNGAQRPLEGGFMDLSSALVHALTGPAGLYWGGQYRRAKDLMHFDWRSGTIRNNDRH